MGTAVPATAALGNDHIPPHPELQFTLSATDSQAGEQPAASMVPKAGLPPKKKRRGAGAPWQTHVAVTPEVTSGYALRKRKSPLAIEAPSAPATVVAKKRACRKVVNINKPQKSPVLTQEHPANPGASKSPPACEGPSILATPTPKTRLRKRATRPGGGSVSALVASPEGMPVVAGETSSSAKLQNAVSPNNNPKPNKGKERVRDSPVPPSSIVGTHHHNLLALSVPGSSDGDDWDAVETIEDNQSYAEAEGEGTGEDDCICSELKLTEEGRLIVPFTSLLLSEKSVDICACGKILDGDRGIPAVWMGQQPDPREFLLGGFTDTQLEQALRDRAEHEQGRQGSPEPEYLTSIQQTSLDPWQQAVREYADQFHEQVYAVEQVGRSICALYETMAAECDNCRRQSRKLIRLWEHRRDMIFDHGHAAFGILDVNSPDIVKGEDHVFLELKRAEARARRQEEEAQAREIAYWQKLVS